MLTDNLLRIREDIKNKFSLLEFNEEKHTYSINNKYLPSVSGLLKSFYEPFDPSVAKRYAIKNGFDEEQVKLAWFGEGEIANDNGNRVHIFGENYVNWKFLGIGEKPNVTCKQSLGVLQFWNHLPERFTPIFTELRMYSESLGYAGTTDILCFDNQTGKLIIMDYKTNKEIVDERQKPLYHIDTIHNLRQDNLGKYTLQFNLYQILLEEIGYEIGGRILIWLREQEKDQNGNAILYRTFKTKDVSQDIRSFLHKNPI